MACSESNEKDLAATLVELTTEVANEEYFVVIVQ